MINVRKRDEGVKCFLPDPRGSGPGDRGHFGLQSIPGISDREAEWVARFIRVIPFASEVGCTHRSRRVALSVRFEVGLLEWRLLTGLGLPFQCCFVRFLDASTGLGLPFQCCFVRFLDASTGQFPLARAASLLNGDAMLLRSSLVSASESNDNDE